MLTYHIDQPKSSAFNLLPGLPLAAGRSSPAGARAEPGAAGGTLAGSAGPPPETAAGSACLLIAAALACAAFLLTGCIGIFGTIDATYTFKKVEYIDSSALPRPPHPPNRR